eukprot:CAMPEP_0116579760 /NCGR_PEP_ID=MMETSP0397-20121206/22422_1 /TAXON_ID=216820 /ORGANISM="Cyclophora tenuis, Strain ECT3854" /LENGTH=334 /DNA_ID=CAMNT_0004109259 /DNA_START=21 /DNA_END=1025 /DNA_ORIENTATION=-
MVEGAKPDLALAQKLLCANVVAQSVDSTTSAYRTDGYYTGAGFTREPVVCMGGVITDWLIDAQVWHKPQAAGKFPGKLHSGFLAATSHVWSKEAFMNAPLLMIAALSDIKVPKHYARDVVKQIMQETGINKIYVTGHSKGAAMAVLGAWFVKADLGIVPECYTFAAPYAGNKEFADAYNDVIPHFGYENFYDIVCLVPPPEPSYVTDISKLIARDIIPFNFKLTMGLGFAAIDGAGELLELTTGLFDYVPVGTRYVVKDGQVTVHPQDDNYGDAFEKYRDDRWKGIIANLQKLGSVTAVGKELGDQHSKECKSANSYGVYMFSVDGQTGVCPKI